MEIEHDGCPFFRDKLPETSIWRDKLQGSRNMQYTYGLVNKAPQGEGK